MNLLWRFVNNFVMKQEQDLHTLEKGDKLFFINGFTYEVTIFEIIDISNSFFIDYYDIEVRLIFGKAFTYNNILYVIPKDIDKLLVHYLGCYVTANEQIFLKKLEEL